MGCYVVSPPVVLSLSPRSRALDLVFYFLRELPRKAGFGNLSGLTTYQLVVRSFCNYYMQHEISKGVAFSLFSTQGEGKA